MKYKSTREALAATLRDGRPSISAQVWEALVNLFRRMKWKMIHN